MYGLLDLSSRLFTILTDLSANPLLWAAGDMLESVGFRETCAFVEKRIVGHCMSLSKVMGTLCL